MEITINVKIAKRSVPMTIKEANELYVRLGELLGKVPSPTVKTPVGNPTKSEF